MYFKVSALGHKKFVRINHKMNAFNPNIHVCALGEIPSGQQMSALKRDQIRSV